MNIKRFLLLALIATIMVLSIQIGCDELVTEYVTVIEAGHPIADFSLTDPSGGFCCAPCTATFHDESDGPRHIYIWNFGDGVTDTDYLPADPSAYQSPVHEYEEAGIYTVSLKIIDTTDGGEDIMIRERFVYVGIPPADFVADPGSGCFGKEVSFSPNTYSSNITYEWDFGDGSPVSNEPFPTHIFADTGTFTVKLTVDDVECDTASFSTDVIVGLCPVIAFAASDSSGCTGAEITFFDGSETWGQTVTDRRWSFGDGGISVERDPVHQYNSAGTYTVSLTVETDAGSSTDSIVGFIAIADATIADFDVQGDTAFCKSDFQQFQVNFLNMSQGAFDSSRWYFGDGYTDTATDPIHVYFNPGVYTCSLLAYGPCGGDTIVKDSFIFLCDTLLDENIVLDWDTTYAAGSTLPPVDATFSDASTVGIRMDWQWYINQQLVSNGSPAFDTSLEAGTYGVKLVVSNECGSAEDSVEIVIPTGL